MMASQLLIRFLLVWLIAESIFINSARASNEVRDFMKWGSETLACIERDHRIAGQAGYYEDQSRTNPAYAWGTAILLLAYAKAAQVEQLHAQSLTELIDYLSRYWVEDKGIGGYDCLPAPRNKVERYYDDNAWIAMGLMDAWTATGKPEYLKQAEKTLSFCLSGIDPNDGGIWWKETWDSERRKTKNTCSAAPTAYACLRYYEATRQQQYLETAKELLKWLDAHLKDSDSLYFDSIRPSTGRIGRRKWSYNSAMPLRCYVLLYKLTGDCLEQAEQIAKACQKEWFDETSGAVRCESMFAFTLIEGWLELSEAAGQKHWKNLAERGMLYVRQNVRDPNGRYSKRWDATNTEALTQWKLLYPAAAARAYWALAAK
ncbi:MAG: AGE family epimerase/isomerase [Phycisphaerae bacterium]|nr:AGE family epimerase/isomerase [Phycisphaerae bacterium]